MKLWILRPIEGLSDDDWNPWAPWYDKSFGFIVSAHDQETARNIAAENAGDEGKVAWLTEHASTCTELIAGDIAGLIMKDVHGAI